VKNVKTNASIYKKENLAKKILKIMLNIIFVQKIEQIKGRI
jgi:hypothetical protein